MNSSTVPTYQESIGIIGYLTGLEKFHSKGQHLGQLRMVLPKINSALASTIKLKFLIVSDTEFTGVVKRIFPLQDFLAMYHEEFGRQVGTHFGVGLGRLGSKQEREPGGCFYTATGAVNEAKEKGEFLVFKNFEMNQALNALFFFVHEMNEKMTDRQRQIIDAYRRSEEIAAVANQLYLSKQAIIDSIKAANYETYQKAWKGIQELLRCRIKPFSAPIERTAPPHHQHRSE